MNLKLLLKNHCIKSTSESDLNKKKKKRSPILKNLPRRKIDISEKCIYFWSVWITLYNIPRVFPSVRYVSTFSRAFIQLWEAGDVHNQKISCRCGGGGEPAEWKRVFQISKRVVCVTHECCYNRQRTFHADTRAGQ